MTTQRKKPNPEAKSKVALAAIRGEKTANEIASLYQVHPVQVARWKRELLEGAPRIFMDGRTKEVKARQEENEFLLKKIGELTMDLEWLKKKSIGL